MLLNIPVIDISLHPPNGSPLASGWTLGEGDGEREKEFARYILILLQVDHEGG